MAERALITFGLLLAGCAAVGLVWGYCWLVVYGPEPWRWVAGEGPFAFVVVGWTWHWAGRIQRRRRAARPAPETEGR